MAGEPAGEPSPSWTAVQWLAEVRRLEREGELFSAYDMARQGLQQFPDDVALKHRAVLCLASTGATPQAVDQFKLLGLRRLAAGDTAGFPANLAMDIAALGARLLKDRALGLSHEARREQLTAAAEAYHAVYRRAREAGNAEAYYPGINCATLRLLAGDRAEAGRLAREILDDLATWPAARKGYYEIATELEALLILGATAAARDRAALIRQQIKASPQPDFRALASTIRQLRLVIGAGNIAFDAAAELAAPKIIHYLGHIISAPGGQGRFPASQEAPVARRIADELDRMAPAFAYGSLAAGADILFAEALLERGASLHVVLPFKIEEFLEVSVRPAGANWVDRFHRCFERAATTHFATDDRYLGDDSLFSYCSQLAMGLAVLRAGHLCAEVEQIAVWDGNPPAGLAGTAADMEIWRGAGMPQTAIPVGGGRNVSPNGAAQLRPSERRTRAMLFGDVKGFSKLTDNELPRFVETVLGTFARVLEGFKNDILLSNTWGDGLFLVFDDAGKAASCALALQEAMTAIDLAAAGLPAHMALRLGGHLGPVYKAADPILMRDNFFGAHVSRAARIEPVTPENLVYVTETLAAVLALHNGDAFACHYVGMTNAAKEYGTMPMFLLDRRVR